MNAPGVLGNDTDIDSGTLTAVLVSGVSHGALTLNGNGSFTYTPDANYSGPDSFTYRANDGSLNSNTVTVSLTVAAVNDAPVAVNNNYSTNEDTQLVSSAPGVLGNDTDVEGNPLTAALVAGPSHGTLTLNANGSFTYTPAANYSGPDSFTYRANDGSLNSNTATVSITVTAVNDAPVAAPNSYSTNEDTQLIVNAPGVLGNDTDVDSGTLTAVLVAGPSPRHPDAQQQRFIHLHPGGELQRQRLVHLPGQRRQPEQQHRHRVPHGDRGQRRPGGWDQQLLHPRGGDPQRSRPRPPRQRHRCGRRHPDRPARERPEPRHPHVEQQRLVQLHAGSSVQRFRQLHLSSTGFRWCTIEPGHRVPDGDRADHQH